LVQIKRFDKNKQALIDINWAELIKNKVDFYLKNGDEVFFQSIEKAVESVVTIKGSVEFPGQYALTNTSNISDLLGKGILKPEARTDIGFLLRTNLDKTKKLIQLDLQAILTNPDGIANIALQKEDQLIVYEKARFVDTMAIKVSGAVRQQIEHPFDPDATITLQKAILLAGGLKPEARQNAYIIRTNPENSHQQEYIEVNIKEAINKPTSPANIILQPLDELKVLSKITYTDEATISISGQVRNPSEFKYATSLKLKDLITLSGGLKLGAALDRVDIYRLEIDSNNSVKTVIKKLTVDSSLNFVSGLKQPFLLNPYDEVVIRTVPDFEFQKYVQIKGEVKYAGKYALTKDNESLSSLIQRAGGVTKEAFVEGATIFRTENNKGLVVTKLDKVLSNKNTKYNYILKEGDIITIPTKEDLVTIQTINTRAIELYPEKFIASGKINVAYEMRKKAKWYIKEYANGFGANASKSSVSIEYPNGELKRTKNWVFFKIYPKVKKGSVILVGAKAPKTKKAKKERKPFDLQQVVSNVFSAISLTLTTVILARQL